MIPWQLIKLRWNCVSKPPTVFANFNRHYAEHSGYWQTTDFVKAAQAVPETEWPIKFYDSVTGSFHGFVFEGESKAWLAQFPGRGNQLGESSVPEGRREHFGVGDAFGTQHS
jgi:hypothetical protein